MLKEEYKNIIAFHPGYYLTDVIEELEMTQDEFAKRLGTTGKTVSLLLNGQTPLTNDLAMKISAMLGISVETLLNLQKTYDEKKIEIDQARALDEQIEVVDVIDYTYFVKHRFLPDVKTKPEKIKNLCAFLKVSDLKILNRRDLLASFRTTVTSVTDKNVINANVWLQTALNKGLAMEVATFDEKKLKSHIKEIRSMTLQEPSEFLPRLCQIFKECGVAFVLLPALKNCGINGVVKWYEDKVVLALNDRFKYADAFWFSLFHEIKHVFQKKKTKVIINCDDFSELEKEFEDEANDYATDTLIPKEAYHGYFDDKGKYISKNDVKFFARHIGVHPGIVVGRLQHDDKIAHSSMSDMRQKYMIVV